MSTIARQSEQSNSSGSNIGRDQITYIYNHFCYYHEMKASNKLYSLPIVVQIQLEVRLYFVIYLDNFQKKALWSLA